MREFVSKYFWVIVSVLMLGVDTFMFVNGSVISQPVAFAHIALFWVFLGVTSVIMRLVSEQEITYVKLIARMSNDLEELEKELSNSLDRLEKELSKKEEYIENLEAFLEGTAYHGSDNGFGIDSTILGGNSLDNKLDGDILHGDIYTEPPSKWTVKDTPRELYGGGRYSTEEWDTGPDVGEEVIENHQGYYDSEDSCDRIIKSLEDRAEEAFKKIARNRSKALEGGFVNGEDYERWLVENSLEEDKDD